MFVSRDKCVIEWDTLKACVSANFRNLSMQKFALKLVTDEGMRIQYPSMSILAEIVLTYAASIAEVEQGFSYQNSTKTKCRNCLSSEHLDQLIRLRLNVLPHNQFPFDVAYKIWHDAKQRHLAVSKPKYLDMDSDDF